jgi:hypothetical protein
VPVNVNAVNGLAGSVVIAAGAGATVTTSGSTVTIAATGSSGNFVNLGSVTLASAQGSVTFSSIPGSYRLLKIFCGTASSSASTADGMQLVFNGDTGANYQDSQGIHGAGTFDGASIAQRNIGVGAVVQASLSPNASATEITIPDYAGTTFYKTLTAQAAYADSFNSNKMEWEGLSGTWANTAPVSSITLTLDTGSNFVAGSTFTLYGLD